MASKDGSNRRITRREFLSLSAASAAAVMLFNPALSRGVQAAAGASTPQGTYKEAPMLAKRVQRRILPPVDQRLPQNPCVLPALADVQFYDGLIHRGYKGMSDNLAAGKMIDHGLVWFDKYLNVVPHICASWQTNADA